MAQRQESSVSVSIEELLREAHARDEQDRRDAAERARAAERRRVEELRRAQQAEEARLRTEEAERRRRVFEEEKRRVELLALHEGTVERARSEAALRAHLVELTARQEHERSLHALRQDRQKRRLAWAIVLLTVLALGGAIGAGSALTRSREAAAAADARLRGIEGEKDRLEAEQARLKQALDQAIESASDPGEVARLQQQLADAQRQLRVFAASSPHSTPVRPPALGPPAAPQSTATARTSETCPKGDPLCPTIQ